jgi:hypothetical protein
MWHSPPGAALLSIGLAWLALLGGGLWLWWQERRRR